MWTEEKKCISWGTFSPTGKYDSASWIEDANVDYNDNSVKEGVVEDEKTGNVHSTTLKSIAQEEVKIWKYGTWHFQCRKLITSMNKKKNQSKILFKGKELNFNPLQP